METNGPPGLGPRAMADGRVHALANNQRDPVFRTFEAWMKPDRLPSDQGPADSELRASIARGSDIFLLRQFWLRDAAHINDRSRQSNQAHVYDLSQRAIITASSGFEYH